MKKFKVIDQYKLKNFMIEMFLALGFNKKHARIESEVLLWANLRGIDSHGVRRLPLYECWVIEGEMRPNAKIKILRESAATTLIDADKALGPVAMDFLMRIVIQKAKNVGVSWGVIRNNTHEGAFGYYVSEITNHGMVGIASAGGMPNMAMYGGASAGLSNSPFAIGVPNEDDFPLVLDMATSVVAGGKIDAARETGSMISSEWALDSKGQPTKDPFQAQTYLPFGGAKGSGLALMLNIMTSLLANNPLLAPVILGKEKKHPAQHNSFIAALDIEAFLSFEDYKQNINSLVDALRRTRPSKGFDGIMLPGEPEIRIKQDREEKGVPLPEQVFENLKTMAIRLGVDINLIE